MVRLRIGCSFLLLFSLVVAQASTGWLSVCVPAGRAFSCSATFNYTGPLSGEDVVMPNFTSGDGDYALMNPAVVKASLQQVTLVGSIGNQPSGVVYPLASLYSYGSCSTNTSGATLFDICGNWKGPSVVPTGWFSKSDLCGATSSSFYTWLCGVNSFRGAVGLSINNTGNMFVSDSSFVPQFLGNITYVVDGVPGTILSDLSVVSDTSKSMWVGGVSFPVMDSSVYPFWIMEGSNIWVPNSKYFASKKSQVLDRNWIAGQIPGYDGVATSVFYSNSSNFVDELVSAKYSFCSDLGFICASDNSLVTLSSKYVTRDLLAAAPSNIKFVPGTQQSVLVSTAGLGNFTVSVSFKAIFVRLPPKVTLTSYTIDRIVGQVPVITLRGDNEGNAGTFDVQVYYNTGGQANIATYSQTGEFFVPVESSRITKACVGSSCLVIDYNLGLTLGSAIPPQTVVSTSVTDAVAWFNTANPTIFAIQIVVIVLAGVLVLGIFVFVVYKVLRRGKQHSFMKIQ